MAGEFDPVNGRKPSIGYNRSGPYVRGYRSRPGAPMADTSRNKPMSPNRMTPQSAWDAAFRDTASNNFGEAANPLYVSSFPGTGRSPGFDISSPEPTPRDPAVGMPSAMDDDILDEIPTMDQLANGGTPSHQEMWSKTTASRGWDYAGKDKQQSIFDRYSTKDAEGKYQPPGATSIGSRGRKQFGWASAF